MKARLPAPPACIDPTLGFGLRLRELRRFRQLKQSYIAAIAGVRQATISRWEAGTICPDAISAANVLFALGSVNDDDRMMRRLVENSSLAVHLITDADHRLLAASPARWSEWGTESRRWLGESLWACATDEIVEAETQLVARGWWETRQPSAVELLTSASGTPSMSIQAGALLWERVWLADGTPARLCTSV